MLAMLLYIDPGSGSYLVQMIIAAILGVLFYFKSAWHRVKAFFSKRSQEDKKNSSVNDIDNV